MRHIDRLPIPLILHNKHDEWQKKYEERLAVDSKARPDSAKYAHKSIKDRLYAMSHGKCFYCETKLSGGNREVDHFVEVSIDHTKAYEWENLYLACLNCNDKFDDSVISVNDALDPCRDSDELIQQNITFVDEQICAVCGSERGLKTIKKYRLDTELLDLKRSRWLNKLQKAIITIQKNMINDGRNKLTDEERRVIHSYISPDQPYSLMCTEYLKKNYASLIV